MTAIGNTTRRGFTGHEHLDAVGLVHMNGRVYEPVIGRMLAPDAVVQIGAAQSVNCYAYVWNNPLTRTDPSGWVADNEVSPPWPLPEVPVTGQRIIPDTFASRMAALSLWQPSFSSDPVLRGGGGGGGAGGKGQEAQSDQKPCGDWVRAVQDFTGGETEGSLWDDLKSNYGETMNFDIANVAGYGVGLDSPIAMGTAPFVAQTWGGITPGQAVSQAIAASRAAVRVPGLIGIRTPLALFGTAAVSWAWNAVVAMTAYRAGVAVGSAVRAGANHAATLACAK
jgi:RHS repeat-associated protein